MLVTLVVLLVLASASAADCRRRCVVHHEVAVAAVAVAPVAVPVLVPYAVQVPTYSAGYAQPAVTMASTYSANYQANSVQVQGVQTQAQCDVCTEIQRLTATIDRLLGSQQFQPRAQVQEVPETVSSLRTELMRCRKELEDLKARVQQPAQPQPTAPVPPQPGKAPQSAAKCFGCHSETAAKDAGKGFVMFSGNFLKKASEFTPQQQTKILVKVALNQMPPKDNVLKVPQLTDEEAAQWPEYFK